MKNNEDRYDISNVSGTSKVSYQIYNLKLGLYEGSLIYAYPFNFFNIKNAKKHIKDRKLKNCQIHKIERITVDKIQVVI